MEALDDLLLNARRLESSAQSRIRNLAFQRGPNGEQISNAPEKLAHEVGLPVDRCKRLLRSAIRAIPLPGDAGRVDILYEDDYILAVNKPPGIPSTPVHRHVGNSMVNRLVSYLGRPPYVRPSLNVL
jgi:23S rRNA-/tRNA-specific pseudouridylate synthase